MKRDKHQRSPLETYIYIHITRKNLDPYVWPLLTFITCFFEQPMHPQKAWASFAIMTASINGLLHNFNKPREIYLCVKFLQRVSFLDMFLKMSTTYFLEKYIIVFLIKSSKIQSFIYISSILHIWHIFIYPMKTIGSHKDFRTMNVNIPHICRIWNVS